MTTRWLAVVALVGCGARPAEPLVRPTPLTPNELPLSKPPHVGRILSVAGSKPPPSPPPVSAQSLMMFPRPVLETAIEPPDVAELGRWPLTIAEHPALEPHFDVASA